MAEKSSPGTRQTGCKNFAWFEEIERKLAILSLPTFTYRSSSLLFYDRHTIQYTHITGHIQLRSLPGVSVAAGR